MDQRSLLCVIIFLGIDFLTKEMVQADRPKSRVKRWLLEPPSTQVGIFTTISTPLEAYKQVSLAYFMEGNWYTLSNVSYLDPFVDNAPIISVRKRYIESGNDEGSIISRKSIYSIIEQYFTREGYKGKSCLLRTICENAEVPLIWNGVVGDILHIIFTPSSSIEEDLDDSYYEAEHLGKRNRCQKYQEDCPKSFLGSISLDFL